jgi:hypothetical protein
MFTGAVFSIIVAMLAAAFSYSGITGPVVSAYAEDLFLLASCLFFVLAIIAILEIPRPRPQPARLRVPVRNR